MIKTLTSVNLVRPPAGTPAIIAGVAKSAFVGTKMVAPQLILDRVLPGNFRSVFPAIPCAQLRALPFGVWPRPFIHLAESVTRVAVVQRHCELLDAIGWLPHKSFPFDLLDSPGSDDAEELSALVSNYYASNWDSIRETFQDQVAQYDVDSEAKEVFRQALVAHAAGLFALVPRSLFPEIERVARLELHSGPRAKITNQKRLREIAGELPISELGLGGLYGFAFYRKMDEHVYECVVDTNLPKIRQDPVPNRHATIHGYFGYSSAQSSVNAIILTEFAFQIIDAHKRASKSA